MQRATIGALQTLALKNYENKSQAISKNMSTLGVVIFTIGKGHDYIYILQELKPYRPLAALPRRKLENNRVCRYCIRGIVCWGDSTFFQVCFKGEWLQDWNTKTAHTNMIVRMAVYVT